MTVLGVVSAIGMKDITSYQVAQWPFGNIFFPFGFPKIIDLDAYGIFAEMFKKTF